jgi:hypothetical protein
MKSNQVIPKCLSAANFKYPNGIYIANIIYTDGTKEVLKLNKTY